MFSRDYELDTPKEWIVAAAVRYGDIICMVEKPGRHHNVLHRTYELSKGQMMHGEQGFVTSDGRFVDREEGCIIAKLANQIVEKHGPPCCLFSEDMW